MVFLILYEILTKMFQISFVDINKFYHAPFFGKLVQYKKLLDHVSRLEKH